MTSGTHVSTLSNTHINSNSHYFLPLTTSYINHQQNIEVFFPSPNSHFPNSKTFLSSSSTQTNGGALLTKAIGATTATSIVIVGIFFFIHSFRKRRNSKPMSKFSRDEIRISNNEELKQFGGNIKGLVVDEDGLDVIYWRQLSAQIKQEELSIINKKCEKKVLPKSSNSPMDHVTKPELLIETNSADTNSCLPQSGIDEISIQVQMKVKGNEDDHSLMVEKKISDDFCSSKDITEALFGYVATNRKSPAINKNSSNKNKIKISNTDPTAQIFILEPQKSESTSMILRSLFVTRKEILDVLLQGRMSFDLDTLEKLTRISPTQDEQEQIFEFNGNQTKLADSESFIYHLLKAVSFPFDRLNSLFFRSKYESKILFLKKSLEILELGCNELRVNGVFFNLLESIIKTQWSTTMNQEFSFGELLNLSDVKNIDRNSNLLQFVVEELVKSEGKNFINKQSQNFDQRNTQKNKTRNSRTQIEKPKEEREDHEYLKLGLPIVEGICKELSYAKKSALIDCNTYEKTWVEIKAGFTQIKDLLKKINNGGKEDDDGFVRKMKRFLYRSEKEFKVLRESEKRLMKILKNTIELYFESGKASLFDDDDQNENPVLLFVMVKDFISMVDHVCINIAMKLKKTEKEGLRFQRLSSIL